MRRAALLAALALGACGSSKPSLPVDSAAPPPTLPASAVPYLPSQLRVLTAAHLAREEAVPGLRSQLAAWGFVAGAERYFQGESRQLQVVDSRALRFAGGAGARAFVAFVARHVSVYLGSFPRVRPLRSGSRSGILAIAQPCQCHLANPAFLGVVVDGATVRWLEINGPGATRRKLSALLARAP